MYRDPDDRPTRAEAEAETQGDHRPWALDAWVITREDHDVVHTVLHLGRGYSSLMPGERTAQSVAQILRDTTSGDLEHILQVLTKGYGMKCEAEALNPPPYEPETEWDEASDQYDPF